MASNIGVIGHVNIRLPGVNFIWVVHRDYASILHRYGDMSPQILVAPRWTRKERRKNEKRKRKGEEKGKGRKKVSERGKGKEKERRKNES